MTCKTDELVEQLTAMQEPRNQKAFRDTLQSIVRLAKVEGKHEAVNTARNALLCETTRSVH